MAWLGLDAVACPEHVGGGVLLGGDREGWRGGGCLIALMRRLRVVPVASVAPRISDGFCELWLWPRCSIGEIPFACFLLFTYLSATVALLYVVCSVCCVGYFPSLRRRCR